MNYSLSEIDLTNQNQILKVTLFLQEVFALKSFSIESFKNKTQTNSENPSLYIAALINNKIIGFCAFISHDLIVKGKLSNCYQVCWAATSKEHRKLNIFTNIVEYAKVSLNKKGAGFIFAFPNPSGNSYSIFISKMHFREVKYKISQVLNIPFFRNLHIKTSKSNLIHSFNSSILQNDPQLIILKEKEYGDKIIKIKHESSYLWGVIRTKRKLNLNVNIFDIGGVFIDKKEDLKILWKKLFKQNNQVDYYQFVSTSNNPYNSFFRFLRNGNTDSLVIHDLNQKTLDIKHFVFFGGIKDVF